MLPSLIHSLLHSLPHSPLLRSPPDPAATPGRPARRARPRRPLAAATLTTLVSAFCCLGSACSLLEPPPPPPAPKPAPPPPPPPAPVPVVVQPPPDPALPADLAARRLLAYNELLHALTPPDLASEIARLSAQIPASESAPGVTAPAAAPDVVLDLSLALALQHNPGDLARAAALLDPLAQSTSAELQAWQPLAQLLATTVAEQRRLDELTDRQSNQLRDAQHTIQQLTEKLEALKAIERSMIKRSSGPDAPSGSRAP